MNVTVTEAAQNLEAILQRAEEGDEVVITRNGHAPIQLVRMAPAKEEPAGTKPWREMSREERRAVLDEIRGMGNSAGNAEPGTSNHDFLYDENGLPA